MADATLEEVRNRTLEKLFVLIAGEVADAEDTELVERVIANKYEELREMELCYWDDDATPQYLVERIAHVCACSCANDFMDAQEALTFKTDLEDGAEASLRKLRALVATRKKVATPTRGVYF